MYEIILESYLNEDPWALPFEKRFRKLCDMIRLGFRSVIYLYEQADTSTFRYRAYNMCQALRGSTDWYGEYFFSNELVQLEQILDKVDVIVVVRFRWSFQLDLFLRKARRLNKPVVLDVDDMIYSTEYLELVTNTLAVEFKTEEDYTYWFSYIGRIQKTASLCTSAITTNQFIAEKIKDDLNLPCYIIPNFYNREQEKVSNIYFQQKQCQKSRGKFVIGYFSGTPSHINDFLTVASELEMLLKEYEDIILRIVGFMELPDYMRKLEEQGKVERLPLQNFIDLQAEIAKVDVNIVPLVENDFTNCKSELKYFEAGIVGTPTCAAPTFVYKDIIKNKENGFICHRGEWYSTIKTLYEKGVDKNLINKSKQFSCEKYAYHQMRPVIENVLRKLVAEI